MVHGVIINHCQAARGLQQLTRVEAYKKFFLSLMFVASMMLTLSTFSVPAMAESGADKTFTLKELVEQGKGVYNRSCAACHGATGAGIPGVFPGMTNSPIVLGDIKVHIDMILNGVSGTAMQAFRDRLSDVEIAAVVAYERNALGNSVGDFVQPKDIKAAR